MTSPNTPQHTPGPWTVRHAEEGPARRRLFIVRDSQGKTIAENRHPHDWTEATANARLIAAAPEMLAACKLALRTAENTEAEWALTTSELGDALRAVISKAESLEP